LKEIYRYKTPNGKVPFDEWIQSLTEQNQARIDAYIKRAALGAAKKNIEPVGEGVFEIKIDVGPGFRVYFGEKGRTMILLLLGGDKSTQRSDIRKAKEYWRDYNAED